jgi:hypothetical protein
MVNTNFTRRDIEVYYTRIKLLDKLPSSIKSSNHETEVFKPVLKDYLPAHAFYLEE